MMYGRRWGAFMILAGVLAAGAARAQQPTSSDPIGEAIQVVKDAADAKVVAADKRFHITFRDARTLLIERQKESLPRVVALLDENVTQTRINAAIILAGFAGQDTEPSQGLVDAWKRCLNDSSGAVVLWGLVAMLKGKAPAKEKQAALAECLRLSRPRVLRIAAATVAADSPFEGAALLLLEHLQQLLPAYKSQVKAKLVLDRIEEVREEGPGIGPGKRPMAPVRTPGGVAAGAPALKLNAKKEVIDTTKLTASQAEKLIPVIQELPAYQELHNLGILLEKMVEAGPGDRGFGFKTTPPWALDTCVATAVVKLKRTGDAKPAPEPSK